MPFSHNQNTKTGSTKIKKVKGKHQAIVNVIQTKSTTCTYAMNVLQSIHGGAKYEYINNSKNK